MGENSNDSIEELKKRIAALIGKRTSHKEILGFLKEVMIEQYKIRPKVKTVPIKIGDEETKALMDGSPLLSRRDLNLDTASAAELFGRLCKILSRRKQVSEEASRISDALRSKDINLVELFKHVSTEDAEYISVLSKRLEVKDDFLSFLAKNSIRPIFEAYASQLKGYVDQEMWWRGYCPICGSKPFIGEFREEGERFLACSLCSFEWRFMRLKCPFCENEEHKSLRYFYTKSEGAAIRVDVCEKCKRYIKTLDTREMAGEVIPIVEDTGTIYLDVLAQEEGYIRGGITHGGVIN